MTNYLISKKDLIEALKSKCKSLSIPMLFDNEVLDLINSAPVVNGEATGDIRIIGYVSESDLTFPFAYPSLSYQSETRIIPVYIDALIEHDEIPSSCKPNHWSSACCKLGTKCCGVKHEESEG